MRSDEKYLLVSKSGEWIGSRGSFVGERRMDSLDSEVFAAGREDEGWLMSYRELP